MSDHDALLRALIDNPAEDTPRLVFADWLDEYADSFPTPAVVRLRAAFIRDDVLMSQRDEFDPLRLRWELIEKPQREAEEWVKESLPELRQGWKFIEVPLFRRGFPWAVRFSRGPYQHHRLLPIDTFPLECVKLVSCGHHAVEAVQVGEWRSRVSAIEFEGYTNISRLLEVDRLDRLERLSFVQHAIGTIEARELVASPLFRQLTALTISDAPRGGAVAEAIAGEGAATGLRELSLTSCRTPVALLASLLASPAAAGFESLALGGDQNVRSEKLRVVAEATGLTRLRSLDLSADSANEAGLEALVASPLVGTLQRLNLSRCSINRDRARLLASGAFDQLRMLKLNGNTIGNDGAAALVRSLHLAGLLVLELRYSYIGDEGIEAILESPLVDGLVLLDLTGEPASDETKQLLKARMGDRVRV